MFTVVGGLSVIVNMTFHVVLLFSQWAADKKVTPFNSTSEREADGDREQDGEKQPLNMTERERKLGPTPKLCSLLTEQRTKPHIQVIGGWLLRICRITDEVLPQREQRKYRRKRGNKQCEDRMQCNVCGRTGSEGGHRQRSPYCS